MSSDLIDMTDVLRVGGTIEIRFPRIVWVKMHQSDNPGLLLYNTLVNHHDRITLGECERIARLILVEENHGGLVDVFLRFSAVDIWVEM